MPGNKAAQERAARKQADIEERKRQARAAKREAHRASSMAGTARATASAAEPVRAVVSATGTRTFGEVITDQGLVTKTSAATRRIISETGKQAEQVGRTTLKVLPSCHTCTAAKGCCKIATTTFLYETVPIAARLRSEGRDTPELRAQLEAAADAMESTRREDYFRPCVFLDANERCTIYEDRPSECGTTFVFSEPSVCSSTDPNARIQKFPAPLQTTIPKGLEETFLADVGLQRTDHPYLGALPRMVLLSLEAWDRTDYVSFLSEHGRRAAFKFASAIGLQR